MRFTRRPPPEKKGIQKRTENMRRPAVRRRFGQSFRGALFSKLNQPHHPNPLVSAIDQVASFNHHCILARSYEKISWDDTVFILFARAFERQKIEHPPIVFVVMIIAKSEFRFIGISRTRSSEADGEPKRMNRMRE